MIDRELLELAAKAAGYQVNFELPVNEWYPNGYDEDGHVIAWWNPIEDDGDALRLAVRLGIADLAKFFDDDTSDPYAATRRAIVRAAAEIGKQMESQKK